MTKKNLEVEATYRVLGKELTVDEARELYYALQKALNISLTTYYPYYKPSQPYWLTAPLIGGQTTISNDCSLVGNVVEVYNT